MDAALAAALATCCALLASKTLVSKALLARVWLQTGGIERGPPSPFHSLMAPALLAFKGTTAIGTVATWERMEKNTIENEGLFLLLILSGGLSKTLASSLGITLCTVFVYARFVYTASCILDQGLVRPIAFLIGFGSTVLAAVNMLM